MKYVSLKDKLRKFFMYSVMITSLTTVSLKANEINKAYDILKTFKTVISNFFDKKNTEKYSQHVNKFAKIVDDVEDLANRVEDKYNETNSKKDKQLLEILHDVKENAEEIYQTLNKKYKNSLYLAIALGKIIHKNKKRVDLLEKKLNQLKEALGNTDKEVLVKFIVILKSLDEKIPTSKITCFSLLNRVWKRK